MKKLNHLPLLGFSTIAAALLCQSAMAQFDPMSAIENSLVSSLAQSMAGSVVNGQIGSQLSPGDQNYRLQQLNGAMQSGNVSQPQQWVNPQTGSNMGINPVGQTFTNSQNQQQCQNLQETVTMPNGQTITENRMACQNPQTGQWSLVQ